MTPKTRKIVTSLAGLGLVVVMANPSGALPLPWSPLGSRPSLDGSGGATAGTTDAADGTALVKSDPIVVATTVAVATTGAASAGASGASTGPAAEPSPTTVPGADGTTPTPATTGAGAPAPAPVGDATPSPEPPHQSEPATTAAKGDDRTPASLSLACALRSDGGRTGVTCRWSGATPGGATRLLVLRDDGRVRLSTDNVARRDFADGDAAAGRRYSYVVVFLDAGGRTIAHTNPSLVEMPAAPAPAPAEPTTAPAPKPEPSTAPAPKPEPKPAEPAPTTTPKRAELAPTTTVKPAEPAPTTTKAPQPASTTAKSPEPTTANANAAADANAAAVTA